MIRNVRNTRKKKARYVVESLMFMWQEPREIKLALMFTKQHSPRVFREEPIEESGKYCIARKLTLYLLCGYHLLPKQNHMIPYTEITAKVKIMDNMYFYAFLLLIVPVLSSSPIPTVIWHGMGKYVSND